LLYTQRYISIACFGGSDLSLEGTLRYCDAENTRGGEPAWFWARQCALERTGYEDALLSAIGMRLAEAVDLPRTEGGQVQVTGHLDDPAARSCTEPPIPGIEPSNPELVRLQCRLEFVVTELKEL
jgi:hypothetical protein